MILVQNVSVLLLSLINGVKNILPESLLNLTFAPASCDDVPLPLHVIAQNSNLFSDMNYCELLEEFNKQLFFNDNQLSELEKITRNQPGSKIQRERRKGLITTFKTHEVYS